MLQKEKSRDLDELHQMVYDFLNDLDQVLTLPEEKSDLASINFFYKRLHKESVMKHINNKLLPHKNRIDQKDVKFFNEESCIFGGLDENRVLHYKTVFLNKKRVCEADLNMIWEYMSSMIALVESYNKT